MRQFSLAFGPGLPDKMRQEAQRRGLDIDASIEARDRRLVGVVSGAIAALNFCLGEAAESGFEIVLTAHHQDLGDRPRRAMVRGRMRRLAIDERI